MAAVQVAEFIDRGVQITAVLKDRIGGKIKDFRDVIGKDTPSEIMDLRKDVEEFATSFEPVGYDYETMVYKN